MEMVLLTALGVGGATMAGAILGFCFRKISHRFSDIVLSFAAGVMLSAAVLGLILPSVECGGQYGIVITLIGIFAGAVTSLLTVFLLCSLFSLDRHVSVSLLPKSITTAIGLALSEQNGGNPTLTSIVIVITGVLGNLVGPSLCKLLKLTDPVSQGVAFGVASHLGGTSKATEMGPLAGAVSSLSLVVAGIVSALIFPLFCALL